MSDDRLRDLYAAALKAGATASVGDASDAGGDRRAGPPGRARRDAARDPGPRDELCRLSPGLRSAPHRRAGRCAERSRIRTRCRPAFVAHAGRPRGDAAGSCRTRPDPDDLDRRHDPWRRGFAGGAGRAGPRGPCRRRAGVRLAPGRRREPLRARAARRRRQCRRVGRDDRYHRVARRDPRPAARRLSVVGAGHHLRCAHPSLRLFARSTSPARDSPADSTDAHRTARRPARRSAPAPRGSSRCPARSRRDPARACARIPW